MDAAPGARKIGRTIRRARERKRMSQQEAANQLGVSRSALNAWENDRAYPRSSIGAIEELYGISLDDEPVLRDLEPEDDWERAVLADPNLTDSDKRLMITTLRRVRTDLYPGAASAAAGEDKKQPPPGEAAS